MPKLHQKSSPESYVRPIPQLSADWWPEQADTAELRLAMGLRGLKQVRQFVWPIARNEWKDEARDAVWTKGRLSLNLSRLLKRRFLFQPQENGANLTDLALQRWRFRSWTDWAVLPARKMVPGLFGLDMASLVLAWLVQSIYIGVLLAITGLHGGMSVGALGIALIAGLIEALRLGVYLAMASIIISAVFSWMSPHAAIAPAVHRLAEPLLRPFRRVIPLVGGVDLSPLFALLVLQALLIVLGSVRAALLPFLIR